MHDRDGKGRRRERENKMRVCEASAARQKRGYTLKSSRHFVVGFGGDCA